MKNYLDNTEWVLLYSAEQDAYHVETLEEYKDKPSNGYALISKHKTFQAAADDGRKRRKGQR